MVAALIGGFRKLVGRNVDRHRVIVRTARSPVPTRPPVCEVIDTEELAVGRSRKTLGHDDVLGDGGDLDHAVVEARPEEVAAFAFDRGRDPRATILGVSPDETAVPRRPLGDVGLAAVGNGERKPASCLLW